MSKRKQPNGKVDRRTASEKAFARRIKELESSSRNDLYPFVRSSFISSTATLEVLCERFERQMRGMQGVELGQYVQAVHLLLGMYRKLRVDVTQRRSLPLPIPALREE